jgi:hypothetical protein
MSSHNRNLRAQRVRIIRSIVLESKLFLYFSPMDKAQTVKSGGEILTKNLGPVRKFDYRGFKLSFDEKPAVRRS